MMKSTRYICDNNLSYTNYNIYNYFFDLNTKYYLRWEII